MKSLLSLILATSIFVATAALVCQNCENYNGTTCAIYTNETCTEKIKDCFVTIAMEKIGNMTYYQSARGCAKFIGSCINTYNMTMGTDKQIVTTTHCCNQDHCNRKPITLNLNDLKENQLRCPACMEKGRSCLRIETVTCHGVQDRCFRFSGGVFNGTLYEQWRTRGCTTKNVCESCTRQYKKFLPLQKDYRMTCFQP